jgi:hypothetical protein
MKAINIVLLGFVLLCAGCASAGYKKPTESYIAELQNHATEQVVKDTIDRAMRHPAYRFIPFKWEQMYFGDPRFITWYLLGNDEDGIFGESWVSDHSFSTNINCLTWFRWDVVRNFGHNMGRYPPIGSTCFKKHWNWSVVKIDSEGPKVFVNDKSGLWGKGKYSFKINFNDLKPHVCLKIAHFETRLGWREKGNFGAAFRWNKRISYD